METLFCASGGQHKTQNTVFFFLIHFSAPFMMESKAIFIERRLVITVTMWKHKLVNINQILYLSVGGHIEDKKTRKILFT